MVTNTTEAIIYLANQRGGTFASWYRSHHTFNYGNFFSKHKKPVGDLLVLNDDTLKGGRSIHHYTKENTAILLLPMVGGLEYRYNSKDAYFVEAGQSHLLFAAPNSSLEIVNPYAEEVINYLQIWFRIDPRQSSEKGYSCEFLLDVNKNQLLPLLPAEHGLSTIQGCIGKFDGREEGSYSLTDPSHRLFVFVIEGVFEVEDRLVESRDGLLLWNTKVVEFEALSRGAVILVLEIQ